MKLHGGIRINIVMTNLFMPDESQAFNTNPNSLIIDDAKFKAENKSSSFCDFTIGDGTNYFFFFFLRKE